MSSYTAKIAYLPVEEDPPREATPKKGSEELTMLPQGGYRPSQEILCNTREWKSIKVPSEPNAGLPDQGFQGEVIEWFENACEGDSGPQGWSMMDTFDVRVVAALNIPYIALGTNFSPQVRSSTYSHHFIHKIHEICGAKVPGSLFPRKEPCGSKPVSITNAVLGLCKAPCKVTGILFYSSHSKVVIDCCIIKNCLLCTFLLRKEVTDY